MSFDRRPKPPGDTARADHSFVLSALSMLSMAAVRKIELDVGEMEDS
jgi:hypothetical protein